MKSKNARSGSASAPSWSRRRRAERRLGRLPATTSSRVLRVDHAPATETAAAAHRMPAVDHCRAARRASPKQEEAGEGGEAEGRRQRCRPSSPSRCGSRSSAGIFWSATNWSSSSNGTRRCRTSSIPSEELYGDIKEELADYKVPPFDDCAQGARRRRQGQEGRQRLHQGAQGRERRACRGRCRHEGKAAGQLAGLRGRDGGRDAQDRDRRIPAGDRRRQDRQAGRISGRARLHLAGRAHDRERRC